MEAARRFFFIFYVVQADVEIHSPLPHTKFDSLLRTGLLNITEQSEKKASDGGTRRWWGAWNEKWKSFPFCHSQAMITWED